MQNLLQKFAEIPVISEFFDVAIQTSNQRSYDVRQKSKDS